MSETMEFVATTNNITIKVKPFYSEELSSPEQHKYIFIYKVEILNETDDNVKLTDRYWHVVEEDGTSYKVKGEGVIGQQPVIAKNEGFEYASQAVLYSKTGIMYGSYNFIKISNKEKFEVEIPPFSLEKDFNKVSLN